jgi:hypothetical protein
MTKTQQRIEALSPQAIQVLERMSGSAVGTVVEMPALGNWRGVLAELEGAGLVGAGGGLTLAGSGVALVLQGRYLDRMLG